MKMSKVLIAYLKKKKNCFFFSPNLKDKFNSGSFKLKFKNLNVNAAVPENKAIFKLPNLV